jgi:hypothetical protein
MFLATENSVALADSNVSPSAFPKRLCHGPIFNNLPLRPKSEDLAIAHS